MKGWFYIKEQYTSGQTKNVKLVEESCIGRKFCFVGN